MGVTERHGQGVGLVFPNDADAGQKAADHERDLFLRRGPLADDGQFHLGRGVFVDGGAALARREQDDAADVADLERGERALPDERGLDRDLVGAALLEERCEPVVDREQAVGEGDRGLGGDDAGTLVDDAASLGTDEPVAREAAPGVDPQDEGGGFPTTGAW